MYKIVEHQTVTNGTTVFKNESEYIKSFRLRRNALHYILEIMQSDLRKEGFGTEPIVGGINCYKSEKTSKGNRIITEIVIKVEKA
jgi:hypothetical protein